MIKKSTGKRMFVNMLYIKIIAFAMIVLICTAMTSMAAYLEIEDENFDTTAIEGIPADWTKSAVGTVGSVELAGIDGKVMKLSGSSNVQAQIFKTFDPITSSTEGFLFVELKAMIPNSGATADNNEIIRILGGGKIGPRIMSKFDNTIAYRIGTTDYTIAPYVAGEWFTIQIAINLSANQYVIKIGNNYAHANFWQTSVTSLTSFEPRTNSTGGTFYIDDVKIYTGSKVARSATAYTYSKFINDLNAINAGNKALFTFENASEYTGLGTPNLSYTYGAGKTVTVTRVGTNVNWPAIATATTTSETPVSGSKIIGGDLWISGTDTFNITANDPVTAVGFVLLSRSGSTGSATVTIKYNDNTTDTVQTNLAQSLTDNVFFGWKAPPGKGITSIAISRSGFPRLDDFGFILKESVFFSSTERFFDLSSFKGDLKGSITYGNTSPQDSQPAILTMARYKDGKLEDIKISGQQSVSPSSSLEINTPFMNIGSSAKGSDIKLFLWNSLDGMKPLLPAYIEGL